MTTPYDVDAAGASAAAGEGFRRTGVTAHSLAVSTARAWFIMSLFVPSASRTRNTPE